MYISLTQVINVVLPLYWFKWFDQFTITLSG